MSGKGFHLAGWEKVKSIKDSFAPQRKKLEELVSGFNFKLRGLVSCPPLSFALSLSLSLSLSLGLEGETNQRQFFPLEEKVGGD